MHGLGNDFVVINNLEKNIQLTAQHIKALADRHRGIGFDQLLMVEPPGRKNCDFSYRIFNADGSEVEQCGNGARCFAKFIRDQNLSLKDLLVVSTKAGKLILQFVGDDVQVEMGVPQIAAQLELMLFGELKLFECISIGNPHAVLMVDHIDNTPVEKWGAEVAKNKHFSMGVNVGFMQIIDRSHIRLRVYERGVGETFACGSGACAAVAAGQVRKFLDKSVFVQLPGGRLKVGWPGIGQPIRLAGPAIKVFEGWLIV